MSKAKPVKPVLAGEANMVDVVLLHPPTPKLEKAQAQFFSSGAREFLSKLHRQFDQKIEMLYRKRHYRTFTMHNHMEGVIEFKKSAERLDKSWTIAPLPARLQNRHVDLGDVSACNVAHFISALNADVQAIQVDFDDGHCPTWRNQLIAYNNIFCAVHSTQSLPGAPLNISTCPLLIFRPRAWNIIEHHILIDGKEVPGALIDFGILMYHNAVKLYQTKSGPYFYLSKLEAASEARLWNEMFVWSQRELGIPQGTIKACVLIENIFAVFKLEEILYALKDHSLGFNCGMWDYCASIIAKLGNRKQFLMPDRNKYVNMDQHFLVSYLKLVVATAHARGAPATGGMAALMVNPGSNGQDPVSKQIILKILDDKAKEIDFGVDGFMVYDPLVVPYLNRLWQQSSSTQNQIHLKFNTTVTVRDLLSIPCGGVTLKGLEHNVAVTILFVYHWLEGKGHYFYSNSVEDSATAEISRWQVWQWVRYGVAIEDYSKRVSALLVETTCAKFVLDAHKQLCRSNAERKRLNAARYMCAEIFLSRYPPEFITTYLNDNHKFRALNNKALLKGHL